MRRTIVLLTTMALALVMASGIAVADSQLDQQQTLADGGFAVADQSTSTSLAQTFTAGKSGYIDKVSLYVGCCADASGNIGGTPPGAGLAVYIRGLDSSSGVPGGNGDFVSSGTVPAADFNPDGSLGWVDVPLNPFYGAGGAVTEGKRYGIDLEVNSYGSVDSTTPPPSSPFGYLWGRTTPSAYAGGTAWKITPVYPSGWAYESQDQEDFAFKTFVSPDTTAPDTTITSGPSGPTNDPTPTFSFGGSDDQSSAAFLRYSYKVDGGAWSDYSYATNVSLGGTAGLSEGFHTFYVRAKDPVGNVDQSPAQRSFSVDRKAPKVTSVVPTENATGVDQGVNVIATFSEAMRASSINTSTFQLFRAGTTTPIAAVVSYDAGTKSATLDPAANLGLGTKYQAVVKIGTRDLAGNQLDQNASLLGNQPKKWFFTVGN